MDKTILAFLILFSMVACSGTNIPLVISTPVTTPSSLPVILTPTPPFILSVTRTITFLPSIITVTESQSTLTSTATATFNATATVMTTAAFNITKTVTTTATFTPTPHLLLDIIGCNTSLDIFHQMGEVTNAYPIIRNNSGKLLTNVCATLTASDEARLHPDKTACLSSLPNGYQVVLKLTVDTSFKRDTSIRIDVTSQEGFSFSLARSSCRDIGLADLVTINIGVVEPIP